MLARSPTFGLLGGGVLSVLSSQNALLSPVYLHSTSLARLFVFFVVSRPPLVSHFLSHIAQHRNDPLLPYRLAALVLGCRLNHIARKRQDPTARHLGHSSSCHLPTSNTIHPNI